MNRFILAAFTLVGALLLSTPVAAQPCVDGGECDSGFCVDDVCCDTECDGQCQACSTVSKGGGVDGECGVAAVGTVCERGTCNESTFAFHPPSTCDEQGACIEGGEPVSCLTMGPGDCAIDLCHDTAGCELVFKPDGTACGSDGVCLDGLCGDLQGVGGGGGGGTNMNEGGTPVVDPNRAVDTGCGCHVPDGGSDEDTSWLWMLPAIILWRRNGKIG